MSGTDGRAAADRRTRCGGAPAATHHAGLVSLTHTPSPMSFLNALLDRQHERPFLLLVVGYPAANARVPVISRKPLEHIVTYT